MEPKQFVHTWDNKQELNYNNPTIHQQKPTTTPNLPFQGDHISHRHPTYSHRSPGITNPLWKIGRSPRLPTLLWDSPTALASRPSSCISSQALGSKIFFTWNFEQLRKPNRQIIKLSKKKTKMNRLHSALRTSSIATTKNGNKTCLPCL